MSQWKKSHSKQIDNHWFQNEAVVLSFEWASVISVYDIVQKNVM